MLLELTVIRMAWTLNFDYAHYILAGVIWVLGVRMVLLAALIWLFANHPMMAPPPPEGYQWPLSLLYLVFAGVIVVLYSPRRWYAEVKAHRRRSWMRYL